MSLTPADLRSRIEAQITSALGSASPAWVPSAMAFDAFPGGDLDDQQALAFAVGLPSSDVIGGRTAPGRQVAVSTVVGVRWTYRLRSDTHVADYDAALGQEVELVQAVTATTGDRGPAAELVRIERGIAAEDAELFIGTVMFRVFHQYPL